MRSARSIRRTRSACAGGCDGASWTAAQRRGYRIALALSFLRLALAPAALVALAHIDVAGLVLAAALLLGFLSDVLDGVVARRAGAVTPFLRRLDSSVDTVFYLGVAYAA